MSRSGIKRFYDAVDVAPRDNAFAVVLDGKPLKTPKRSILLVPTHALAEAIGEEWRGQVSVVDPATMPLTRLAFSAIDTVAAHRSRIREEIIAYGRSDLLCYRAERPAVLVARQAASWDPLLGWAAERFGAPLAVGRGIGFMAQSVTSLAALADAVTPLDDCALAALHGAAHITGSLVLALALSEGRLDAEAAFTLSRVDETFQAEAWGRDAEGEARAACLRGELAAIARFLSLLRP